MIGAEGEKTMVWFAIGAALGALQFAVSLARRPVQGGHPVQAFVLVAILGAAVYGTVLWLIFS